MEEEKKELILTDEELKNIKTQYNKAKDLLDKINSLNIRYDAAFKAFETRNVDVEKISTDARDRFLAIENAKNESSTFLSEIKANLEKTQTSIQQINDGLQKFENIKGKIEGKDGEIENLVATANSLKTDIENAKATAQQRLTEIDVQFTQAQEKITKIQEAYNNFTALHARIIEPNTGLQAILDQSVELQKQSNATFAEIKSFNEQSKQLLEQIKGNKSETDKIKDEVQKVLEKINFDKEEVKKITALITDTGFEYAFQKREKMLRFSSIVWLIIFVLSVTGLALMLYFFFKDKTSIPELQFVIYRFTLTSPLLFLIGVAIKQYGDERNLNEKYAFKATIAAVIRNHSKFLTEVEKEAGGENAGFIRETLGSVYNEPYGKDFSQNDLKEELRSILDDNDSDKKTKLENLFSKAKELKELIPDDATLKSVVELISKLK